MILESKYISNSKLNPMSKKIFLLLFLVFLVKVQFSFAQNIAGSKVVMEMYFMLEGIKSDEQAQNISVLLEKNKFIDDAEIHMDAKCKLVTNANFDAKYLNSLLVEESVKVGNEFLLKKDISPNRFTKGWIPADFPQKVETGDPKSDEARLAAEIDAWKKLHPEEWKLMMENRTK